MHSAKVQQTTVHAYQLTQLANASQSMQDGPNLSVSGVNEKLVYMNNGQPRQIDNSNNGYLVKSAQNTVKQQLRAQQPPATNSSKIFNNGGAAYGAEPASRLQGRERGLSASALDQGRVVS